MRLSVGREWPLFLVDLNGPGPINPGNRTCEAALKYTLIFKVQKGEMTIKQSYERSRAIGAFRDYCIGG